MDAEPGKWFSDRISRNLVHLHRIEEVLYTGRTRFQNVEIVRTGSFGISLILDSKIQSSESDEFIYHESLVQPAMVTHPHPGTVFIAGGGEGATLREALSHKIVNRVVMVDIDEEVVALSKKFLPGHSRGAFEDSRTELHHADARDFLAKSKEKFDVIIIDLPDPVEEGPACLLYTREFYQLVRQKLTNNGIISVQAGSASLGELLNLTAVNYTLRSVFPIVRTYVADVPSFGTAWGFCVASVTLDPAQLSPAEVDKRISARSLPGLRFYDGLTHQGMFSLPKYIREAIAKTTRLITDAEPLYIYDNRASI